MDSEIVGLVGFAGKLARIVPGETGGLFGGLKIHFDSSSVGSNEQFEITKPDDKFQIRAVAANVILGADATSFSEDLTKEFYTMPLDKRGGYESWTIVELPSKLVIAFVEYDHNGQKFASASLALLRQ